MITITIPSFTISAEVITLIAIFLPLYMLVLMYFTYLDGEVIIGRRLFIKSRLKVGDVIVYRSPEDKSRKVIKRIADIQKDSNGYSFYCLGDNPPHSHDSRDYGYVSSDNLVCKIIKARPKKES